MRESTPTTVPPWSAPPAATVKNRSRWRACLLSNPRVNSSVQSRQSSRRASACPISRMPSTGNQPKRRESSCDARWLRSAWNCAISFERGFLDAAVRSGGGTRLHVALKTAAPVRSELLRPGTAVSHGCTRWMVAELHSRRVPCRSQASRLVERPAGERVFCN
jgi:hypothetical protein